MLKKYDKTAATLLMVAGIVQLILLLLAMLGFKSDDLSIIIFKAFHIAAIYIPSLTLVGSYLIAKKPFNKKLFYYMIASLVVFFPVAGITKIIFSSNSDPVLDFIHKSFDRPEGNSGSITVLLCITAILVLSSRIVIKRLLGEEEVETLEVKEESVEIQEPVVNETYIDEEFDIEPEHNEEPEIEYRQEVEVDPKPEAELNEEPEVDTQADSLDIDKELEQIKNEINDYYIEEELKANAPFNEPDFPETTEEVDIDALDLSNDLITEIVETELSKEEEDYLKSFEEMETFSAEESVVVEEDPGIAFLSNDSHEDIDPRDWYEPSNEVSDFVDVKIDLPIDEKEDRGFSLTVDDEIEHVAEKYDEEEYAEEEYYDDDDTHGVYVGEPEDEPVAEQRRVLMPQQPSYEDLNTEIEYEVPVNGILDVQEDTSYQEIDEATKRAAAILEQTLEEFNIKGKVTGIKKGPVITMFELLPAPGVKLSKIVNLSDNIALGLAASSVRIVAPIPGKHAVGIEVPNKKRSIVTFSELIESEDEAYEESAVPIILGKNINGDNKIIDLAKTPHLLIAGATGAGKSVCVNSLICSILCKRSHNDVKLIMVDPKIVELKLYNGIPHLLTPVITDPKRAFQAIQWCLYEMERRYALLDSMGVRDIKTYNKRIKEQKIATTKLPYLVLIVDEFADLMATSGKELEGILARLAAMSRAVGIHLVLATQRPSIDVITGLIKANFPSRIAFMVSSKTDSRIILDNMGAEKLLGRGDMLFTSSWDPFPVRIQGSFLSDQEVESVVDYVKGLGEPEYIDDEIFMDEDDDDADSVDNSVYGDDPLFNRALEIVLNAGKASASFLQRRLKIGYNRAARLVEEMEDRGIIGPQNGSKPREILRVPDSHKEVAEYV